MTLPRKYLLSIYDWHRFPAPCKANLYLMATSPYYETP